jgi:sigma-B regulation protein RsbU (phosphoserine phosphatase)
MAAAPLPGPDELYDSAPCGLMLASDAGQLLKVNRVVCKWLGYTGEELLARRFSDLLTMGSRIFHQTHLAPLLRIQGSVAEVKLEFRDRDGKAIPVMVNLAERADAGGALHLHIACFIAEDRHKYERELLLQRRRAEDLATQYAQAQSERAAARAEAEDRAQFAEQMMGVVSHDLRNPLSVVGMSAALLRMTPLNAQQATVVGRIDRSVKHAERLIADLLDFTQARLGGGVSVKPADTDLHAVVADSVSALATAFPERAIVHEAVGPGTAKADPERIVQAVGNLVANAVNYGDPQYPVKVRTLGDAAGFRIEVHNHGAPIPPELQQSLFEPMIRGADKVAGSKGVGLGLYIVREIAKAHGGSVELASTADEGTTFTIVLPAG